MDKLKNIYNFDSTIFNNVFFHLQEAYRNEKIRYIWLYGGSSAGKTFSAVQLTIMQLLLGEGENTLVMRKSALDIRDSIFSDFKTIINEWGLNELFIVQQNYIECKTGSYVRFRGLSDSEKIKGISHFKRIILEEVSQFEDTDFKQVRKRLRGLTGQQVVSIFNPISEDHWIKKNVFDTEEWTEQSCDISGKWTNDTGNTVILKTNYVDNKYIVGPCFTDHHVIADFEKDKLTDYAYYNIYGLGNWGKLRSGGEFWKDFNPNKHVAPNKIVKDFPQLFRPDLTIHMTWDKNVNPYLPCALWQTETIDGITRVWQFDEITFADPWNRVKHVCAEFIKRYPPAVVDSLFVYGDRTAIQEDTTKAKGENFFTEILKALDGYHPSQRIPSTNPSVVQSAGFVNACYAVNYGGIEIVIGDNCKKSIYDYTYALEDDKGGLAKTTKKHPVTKVTYQEFGHFSDAKRYLLTMLFAADYARYRTRGKPHQISVGHNKFFDGW